MKFICIATVVSTIFLKSCSPFKEVTNTISNRTEIFGAYENDCDSVDNEYASKNQLWQTIDKNYIAGKTGLLVTIQETQNNKLLAQLIDGDSLINEKIIKGHFKDDKCYYKRRFFYVVPILPILWWFENRQVRLYRKNDYLVSEEKFDTGGTVVIMAGGNTTNTNRLYKRIR